MRVTYIHGITEEIAHETIGAGSEPILMELLADPTFERRDNVVAFLGYLGGAETTASLLRLLNGPPASLSIPEEDRALLLAPQSLGLVALRGEPSALEALLEMTAADSQGGVLARAATYALEPQAMRDDLLEMALRGLAMSGSPVGSGRLEEIARGSVVPAPEGRDLTEAAEAALELATVVGGAPATGLESQPFELDAMGASGAGAFQPEAGPIDEVFDSQSRVHDSLIDFANHPAVPGPMSTSRLDQILDTATERLGRSDFPSDVACCVTLSRTGIAKSFGSSGDGLDSIDTSAELTAVLNHTAGRFKVVRVINYCGGPAINIAGCGWIGGWGVAIIRLSDPNSEGVLWTHEFGHNASLSHNGSSDYFMHSTAYGDIDAVTSAECNAYHSPGSGTTLDIGACSDSDGDQVHNLIDNCPSVSNPSQLDSDADGVGDACEGSGGSCGDGLLDSDELCDGLLLGGQTCVSRGHDGGSLSCRSDCTFDESACTDCGDGVREGSELCDGTDRGGHTCSEAGCASGTPTCTASCTLDFASCSACGGCDGDDICEGGEDCTTCPGDCPALTGASCGNHICEAGNGEDCLSCPTDCRGRQSGKPRDKYCCGDGGGVNPLSCSNPICTSGGYLCTATPATAACCGDGVCAGLENSYTCPLDCGAPPSCGDGSCSGGETKCACPLDCGLAPATETLCSNSLDDDCDSKVDCADSNCTGSSACGPTCRAVGASCTSSSQCCSARCKGGTCRG